MWSKNRIKLVHSLEQKKYRNKEQLFVAEGEKCVTDLLQGLSCQWLLHTEAYTPPAVTGFPIGETDICTHDELRKVSFLSTPQDVIGVFRIPDEPIDFTLPATELCLALDGVQDPGNLGTIIRVADWFGIRHIYCSSATADAFSPKAVQATMGALTRVHVHYTSLSDLINGLPESTPIYGTLLDGDDLYEQPLENHGLLVMGNEGNGLTEEIRQKVTKRLFIPNYPLGEPTSESLNVGVATAILCAEFRRRQR